MSKRIKSFLITASSLLGTALLAVVLTPEWATFVQFANDKLVGWGIPAVIVALIGVFVSELWKAFLNKRMASKQGFTSVANAASSRTSLDLY